MASQMSSRHEHLAIARLQHGTGCGVRLRRQFPSASAPRRAVKGPSSTSARRSRRGSNTVSISMLYYGNFAAFVVPDYQITSYLEFPAFALLGVTCALIAVILELSIMTTERVAWRIKMPLWLRPAA